MSVEGIRVVRGPNWSHGNEDGGEGHVGTVTQDNEDDTVEVQWDMGESSSCSTGKDGKCDLRILDSAPAGLKHGGVKCSSCSSAEFPGTRWKCASCSSIDLCTHCYFKDKHDTGHPFLRIDAPGMKGETVPKRSTSSRQRAMGLYVGAKVKRGADWNCGNQDGGSGQTGIVEENKDYGTDGRERDAVKVKWANKEANSYRVGYRGKVDLECVEEAPGVDYYREHLFCMSTTTVPKLSVRQKEATVTPKPKASSAKLQLGDRVCVDLPELALKEAQRGHGGWSMRMKEFIGQPGTLKRFEDNGDCAITYDGKEWRFNAEAIRKMPDSVKLGDIVRILSDSNKVQALQRRHGGWQSEMEAVLGKVGKIVKIDSDGDVAVAFGNKACVFNPACCEPAPGCKVFELVESGTGAAGGGGKGKADEEDDDGTDETAEALQRLIAQMFLLRGQRTTVGAQELISAAANNNAGAVQSILSKKPLLIDQKHKGLTALIISSHEGHIDVVKVLLKTGANKDQTDEKGNTPLMASLMKKREAIAMLLIETGANIHLWNQSDRTALHFAASNGTNTVLRELLRKGADVNKQDITGDTPLHDAIENKNNTAVSFLVAEEKINLKLCNKKGFCTMHLAALKDDELTVSRIITKIPGLINATKGDGYTALHIAAVNDNSDVAKTLVKARANLNAVTPSGLAPLHLSCHQGYIATTKVLVENSANVNIQDSDGDTPLHVIFMGRRSGGGQSEQLARLLLGIRVDNEGEVKDRTNLACYLVQEGAKLTIRNKKGRTPLECCSNDRMRNSIKMFAEKQQGGGTGGAAASRGGQGAALLAGLLGLPIPCMGCGQKLADARLMPCRCKVLCKQCSFRTRQCPMCDQPILERYDLEGRRIVLADPCKVQ